MLFLTHRFLSSKTDTSLKVLEVTSYTESERSLHSDSHTPRTAFIDQRLHHVPFPMSQNQDPDCTVMTDGLVCTDDPSLLFSCRPLFRTPQHSSRHEGRLQVGNSFKSQPQKPLLPWFLGHLTQERLRVWGIHLTFLKPILTYPSLYRTLTLIPMIHTSHLRRSVPILLTVCDSLCLPRDDLLVV